MMSDKTANSLKVKAEGRTLVMERLFDAPRDRVFKAFSEAGQLESWWGPKGWQTEVRSFAFKPNGVWHYCMRCTDENQGEYFGQESWGKAVYQDISAPEKIVFIDMFADAEGNAVSGMPETLVKVEFIEGEYRTKLVMRSEFASEEALQQVIDMGIIQGVSSQFERLDNHLKQAY